MTTDFRYKELLENSTAFAVLKRELAAGLSHAYLITGDDPLALDILTDMFLCLAVAGGYTGDRASAVRNHTLGDIIVLPADGEKVKVDDINFLTDTAYFTPATLAEKYYVISRGETMNDACQNKLLKTLEEPPSVTRIIIKASSEKKLLPTVLSRCRKVELSPFSEQEIRAALNTENVDSERLEIAVSACKGSLTRASELMEGSLYPRLYEVAVELLTKPSSSKDAAFASFILSDYKDNLADIIDFAEILLRNGIALSEGALESGGAFYEQTKEIARRFPPRIALKEMPIFARARRRLELNGNITAIIDEMVFSLLEVRAKWK